MSTLLLLLVILNLRCMYFTRKSKMCIGDIPYKSSLDNMYELYLLLIRVSEGERERELGGETPNKSKSFKYTAV